MIKEVEKMLQKGHQEIESTGFSKLPIFFLHLVLYPFRRDQKKAYQHIEQNWEQKLELLSHHFMTPVLEEVFIISDVRSKYDSARQ